MDSDAVEIIDNLPRNNHYDWPESAANAWVAIDSYGRLSILFVGGGWLGVEKKDFGVIHGDVAPFAG